MVVIMVAYPHRLRYTHKIYLYKQLNTVYNGLASASMTVAGYPTEDFKLAVTSSDACRIKVVGSLDGVTITERLSFSGAETQYTANSFDVITTLSSGYFITGTTFLIDAVDSVGMPISWTQTYGPYNAEFGILGGMSAQVEANSLGLGSKMIHYVRIERSAPVSKDMELSVNGFDDSIFVPISDFENISTTPSYIPQEWAFRCVVKDGPDSNNI